MHLNVIYTAFHLTFKYTFDFINKQKVKCPLHEQVPQVRKEVKASENGGCGKSAITLKAFQKKGSRKPNRAKERENEQEEIHK